MPLSPAVSYTHSLIFFSYYCHICMCLCVYMNKYISSTYWINLVLLTYIHVYIDACIYICIYVCLCVCILFRANHLVLNNYLRAYPRRRPTFPFSLVFDSLKLFIWSWALRSTPFGKSPRVVFVCILLK